MRTTLDIDDDLLRAAEELARRENPSSLRRSLTGAGEPLRRARGDAVAGIVPFHAHPGVVVTNAWVNRVCDEDGS